MFFDFVPDTDIDLYFPDEKVEYRLRVIKAEDNVLVASIDDSLKKKFYKGEDLIKCTYVKDNMVYEFGGEIEKITDEEGSKVYIKLPEFYQQKGIKRETRVAVNIPAQYIIERCTIDQVMNDRTGLCRICDLNLSGLSFLCVNNIPKNSTLNLFLKWTGDGNIVLKGDIKKKQAVNSLYNYGIMITDYLDNCKDIYIKLIETSANNKRDML